MRYYIQILMLIFIFNGVACAQETYDQLLSQIVKDRKELKSKNTSLDSCRKYFLDRYENDLFPKWIGTKWDYNGHTNRPGKNQLIACGYFVSTTLKHMGFVWNRYDLAKMYSKAIVEQTCSEVTHFDHKKEALEYVLKKDDNLYIVGLDMHVGLLLKRDQTIYFIHSNYYGSTGPVKEIAKNSLAFGDSENFYIGTFLDDINLIKWLNQTSFTFIRE